MMGKCRICGADTSGKKYICECCSDKFKEAKRFEDIDKACTRLKHKSFLAEFKRKIEECGEKLKNSLYDFDSMAEIMFAIQLMYLGVDFRHHEQINGVEVDFLLTDSKIIVELDGELFHSDDEKEFLRDRKIMASSEEYEIVHILSENVPYWTWDAENAMKFIISERNDNGLFRDSSSDDFLLCNFNNLERYMEYKKYFSASKGCK